MLLSIQYRFSCSFCSLAFVLVAVVEYTYPLPCRVGERFTKTFRRGILDSLIPLPIAIS